MDYDFGINQRILQIRRVLGYTQEKFSHDITLSRSSLAGIEANHRKVNDRLLKIICMTYGVNENWLKTGEGEIFDTEKDPKLERIIRNFNKMDDLLQDYVLKYLDWLVEYSETARETPLQVAPKPQSETLSRPLPSKKRKK
ncbi:helix-turn-helix domain-containing protein [Treponema primitia]